jgi:hypothetical protein
MNACDTKTHHAEDDECRDFRIGALDQGARETFEAALPILYIKYVGDLIEVYLIRKGCWKCCSVTKYQCFAQTISWPSRLLLYLVSLYPS